MGLKKEIRQSKDLEAQALEACNSEPIETPGLVQSYGALLAFDINSLSITYASDNIGEYLNLPSKNIFRHSIKDLFEGFDYHQIANIASHNSAFYHREHVNVIAPKGVELDLSLFRVDSNVVLEVTPLRQALSTIQINSHLKWTLDTIRKLTSVDAILEQSVQALKNITEFDRVMVYRFHPDNSGEVVAEANNGRMESYLGLRFPEYDIPPIARNIFLKIAIRHICNTSDEGVKIKAANASLGPLNLSLGILRGNSPIHGQYLRNMGVVSTLTLPIVIDGKLWGLFALHNKEEKLLNSELTYSSELIGQLVCMVLARQIERNVEKKIAKLHLDGEAFITLNENEGYLKSFWENYSKKLKDLISCDGVAYQINEKVLVHGACPSKSAIRKISIKLAADTSTEIYHFIDLKNLEIKDLNVSKGLLALRLSSDGFNIFIYFFRNEVVKKVVWAGNPEKDIVFEKEKVRLHPRSSFNHFSELNKGKSEPWDAQSLTVAEAALKAFKKAVSIEMASKDRLKIVVHELNHRIRNILVLVRSISRQTAKGSTSVDNYVDSLEKRILALASANSLLTNSYYNPIDLKTLLLQVIPSLGDFSDSLELEGPNIKLVRSIIPMMALVIHELTTNSVKYGALSVKEGKLKIFWQMREDSLVLEWKEFNGPFVKMPSTSGFGTAIIKNAIKYEFDGNSEMEFQEDGLWAQFKIPGSLIGEDTEDVSVLEQVQSTASAPVPIKQAGINVLILEDDYINAQDIENVVAHTQVNEIDTFSNPKQALDAMRSIEYNIAFLDVNLKNETSNLVAQECVNKGIPFYYLTGYGSSFLEKEAFPNAPVLLKPVQTETLKKIIEQHLLAHEGDE